ncbi:MAG: hypothetical protein QM820_29950 [Minicystis sp.]
MASRAGCPPTGRGVTSPLFVSPSASPRTARSPSSWPVSTSSSASSSPSNPATFHDEGLLTYGCACALGEDFIPSFFLQKTRPLLSLFYLPAAWAGLPVFLVIHVLVAATTIPLVAACARALGIRHANVAAAVVACSPVFLWCGPTGLSNSDGVAGLALVLYLLAARRRPFLAGAVLGGLPWIRYEIVPFAALLAAFALLRWRSRALVVGLALWPGLYLLGGAVYHRDLLWALHYPPALPAPMADNLAWLHMLGSHHLGTLLPALFGITPLLVLLPFLRLRALTLFDGVILGAATLYLTLFTLSHLLIVKAGQLWMLGASPRYALQMLPVVAVLAARAVDGFVISGEEKAVSRGWIEVGLFAVLTALAAAAHLRGAGNVALWTLAGAGAALTLARLGSNVAAAPIFAAAVTGPLLLAPAMEREGYRRYPELAKLIQTTEALPAASPPQPVFTNIALLMPYAARTGALRGRSLRFVLQGDHLVELRDLSNPHNGQRARVALAVYRGTFGDTVDATTMAPASLAPGTPFILREDERNELTMPAAVWGPALREVFRLKRFSVAVIKEAP